MSKNELETYAKSILKEHGCDIYTYGGEFSKNIMSDLKEAYPDGMKYPYIDVANAILAISRPEPLKRLPYLVVWDTDSCCDSYGCESYEHAHNKALDTLHIWMQEELSRWSADGPTAEQIEDWDYMIDNCSVEIREYKPWTDTYETVWLPSDDELSANGWDYYKEH